MAELPGQREQSVQPGVLRSNLMGVDLLRGVAILMVLVYHAFTSEYGRYYKWKGLVAKLRFPNPESVLLYPVSFGWSAVALFFVISGFCIHYSYLRNGSSIVWRDYAIRRFWRIYPAYLAALLFFFGFGFFATRFPQWANLGLHLTFFHNLFPQTLMAYNPSFWSLATEVQFYLLYPLFLFLHGRVGIGRLLIGLLALSLLWRCGIYAMAGSPRSTLTNLTAMPMMSWVDWALGAWVAERYYHGKKPLPRKALWALLAVAGMVLASLTRPTLLFCFLFASVASVFLLEWALHRSFGRQWYWRILLFFGTVSYSLYLWHQPLFPVIRNYCGGHFHPALAWFLAFAAVVLAGWISYRLIEAPGMSLGRRFTQKKPRATRETAAVR